MITDALLNILLALVGGIWSIVPEWDLTIGDQPEFLASWLTQWNAFVPVTELFQISGLVSGVFLAFVGIKMVIKVVDWIADVIP
jgi:hypothetical protein